MELMKLPAAEPTEPAQTAAHGKGDLMVYAVSMIRNDSDLIKAILNQAKELFDHYIIVDVQSTDGTSEIVDAFAKNWPHITHLKFRFEEKHQGVMMNALAQQAVDAGADWVFFIDGDEFLHVDGRADFQRYLQSFPYDVMHLPWINLVPSKYGDFEHFDTAQEFRWSGRVHELNKIAVSSAYVQRYPSFNVHEGNHTVSRTINMHDADWTVNTGIPLLHVPVRSAERLRYKVQKALATLRSKHNTRPGEGFHVIRMAEMLSSQNPNVLGLNAISASYSMQHERTGDLDVAKLNWPVKRLPRHCTNDGAGLPGSCSSWATMRADNKLSWNASAFARNSVLRAYVDGEEVKLAAMPIAGGEVLVRMPYATLTQRPAQPTPDLAAIAEAVAASLAATRRTPGAHLPAIAAFLTLHKPRRFVDLGVGAGEAFLELCAVAASIDIAMNCIAVGTWEGKLAGEDEEAFHALAEQLRRQYPRHQQIRAHTQDAVACFEQGSIDLLRLPAGASHAELVRELAAWRPKLTDDAVVLLPQINTHGGDAGAWRLWEEMDGNMVAFEIPHDGGLGFFNPSGQAGAAPGLLALLSGTKAYATLARRYLGAIADLTPGDGGGGNEDSWARLIHERDVRIGELSEGLQRSRDAVAWTEWLALDLWRQQMRVERESLRTSRERFEEEKEIIRFSGMFDEEHYLAANPDIEAAGVDPIDHYVEHGALELRAPNSWFDPARYLLANRDVMLSVTDPFVHFIIQGRAESRNLL